MNHWVYSSKVTIDYEGWITSVHCGWIITNEQCEQMCQCLFLRTEIQTLLSFFNTVCTVHCIEIILYNQLTGTKIYISDVSKFAACFGTYDMPKHVGHLLTTFVYILGASVVSSLGLFYFVLIENNLLWLKRKDYHTQLMIDFVKMWVLVEHKFWTPQEGRNLVKVLYKKNCAGAEFFGIHK
jgi:hypothetical protein